MLDDLQQEGRLALTTELMKFLTSLAKSFFLSAISSVLLDISSGGHFEDFVR